MNQNPFKSVRSIQSCRIRPRSLWLLCALAGAATLTLETTGIVQDGLIDGVTAATKVTTNAQTTPSNSAPALNLTYSSNAPKIKSRTIDEGETLTIKVQARDPDGNYVTLQARGVPESASWVSEDGNKASGLFSWTPPPGTSSTAPISTVTFSATDQPRSGTAPLTTTQPVKLTVGSNTPPALDAIQVPAAVAGKRIKFFVVATDDDNDILSLTHSTLPAGAKFRLKPQKKGVLKGIFTWKPKLSQAGQSFPITFTVRDNYPNPYQDSRDVVIAVGAR